MCWKNKIIIRPATLNDSAGIADLLNIVSVDSLLSFSVYNYTAEDARAMLLRKWQNNDCYIICEYNNRIVGYVTYSDFVIDLELPDCNIKKRTKEPSIGLLREYRNTGIADQLEQAMQQHAKSNNVRALCACVLSGNQQSVKFAHKHGYNYVTTLINFKQRDGQWHDLILLQNVLKSGIVKSTQRRILCLINVLEKHTKQLLTMVRRK